MTKRTIFWATCLAAVLLAAPVARAQEHATLVLRSGERIAGQLVDLGGVGFTMQVNGQDRRIATGDVAAIDFTGGLSDEELTNFGGPKAVLRNGQTVDGQLADIGGRSPLRLTIRTANGDRALSSSEVARVLLAGTTTQAVAPSTPSGPPAITVSSSAGWVATGITVARGQSVRVDATGDIQLSADANDVASAAGSKTGRHAPRSLMPHVLAGALLGRVGSGQPFPIGDHASPVMPASGQLFLTVNDDTRGDNQGAFSVTIAGGSSIRRR